MNTIIVVENDDERIAWFRKHYPNSLITSNVEAAIAALDACEYRMLFLDHDLGTEPNVGRDVARWLIDNPRNNENIQIIVHSMNSVSAPKIALELREAGRQAMWFPYSKLCSKS